MRHRAGFNRVVVKVVQPLVKHFNGRQFDGMVILLPKLVFFIVAIVLASPFEHPHHPLPAAFLHIFADGF